MEKEIKIVSVVPKTKSDGSEIVSARGGKLYAVKIEGSATTFDSWDKELLNKIGQSVKANITKKDSEYNGQTYTNYSIALPKENASGASASGYNRQASDPNSYLTMLIAYAKDLVVAEIASGVPTDSMAMLHLYAGQIKDLYEDLKAGNAPRKIVAETQEQEDLLKDIKF